MRVTGALEVRSDLKSTPFQEPQVNRFSMPQADLPAFQSRRFRSMHLVALGLLVFLTAINGLAQSRPAGGTGCTTPAPPTTDTKCYFGSGCLDSSFGSIGYIVGTSMPVVRVVAVNDIAVQPDGQVLIFGTGVEPASDTDLIVGRLNPDGSFDTTFGDVDLNNPLLKRGFTMIDFTGDGEEGTAGALLGDGRIVVAGYSGSDTAIVGQLNPDGTLDTSFGNNGRVIFQYRFT
jgi:uncharacterized delta-60 repeat protein